MSLFGGNPTTSGSLFGGASNPQTSATGGTGLFGNPQASKSGVQTQGLFTPAKSQFAQSQSATALQLTSQLQQPAMQKQNTLFGGVSQAQPQANPTQQLGLFSQQTDKSPSLGGGLFGGQQTQQQAKPLQTGGGLFGGNQPQNTMGGGLFGGQPGGMSAQPQQQTSLFGQPQQQQQNPSGLTQLQGQNPQYQIQQQMPQTQQIQGYYKLKGQFTLELIEKLADSEARHTMYSMKNNHQLSSTNPYNKRKFKDQPNYDKHEMFQTGHLQKPSIKHRSKQIDDKLTSQQKSLTETKECVSKISLKVKDLDTQIDKAVDQMQKLNISQQSTNFRIQSLQMDMNKLVQYREQLGQAINFYQSSSQEEIYNKVELPCDFFVNLQKDHERLIGMLAKKIQDAQNIAMALTQGDQNEQVDFQVSKVKIYEVCKLIYDQQRLAADQLQLIERKVKQLRAEFSKQMMQNKGYWTSQEEIDQLFQLDQNDGLVHAEIQEKIKQIKNRNIASKLESQLKSLNVNANPQSTSKPKQTPSIKEKLQKGLYNPTLSSKSNIQKPYSLFAQSSSTPLLGKRQDNNPNTTKSSYFSTMQQEENQQVAQPQEMWWYGQKRTKYNQSYYPNQQYGQGHQRLQTLGARMRNTDRNRIS